MTRSIATRAGATARLVELYRSLGLARPRRRVPRQQPPTALTREYARAILPIVEQTREVFSPLLREMPRLLTRANDERLRIDVGEAREVADLVARAKRSLEGAIAQPKLEALAIEFAQKTATYQRIQLSRQVHAALGVDIRIADGNVSALLDAFAIENVALIKDIPAAIAANVEKATTRAVTSGTLWPDLAKELDARFGYGETRSRLIARDQVGKLYGQVAATRQKDLGIRRFVWRTVGDERVRDEHADRDGQIYSYDDPPDGELPGEPILCRCYPDPVFDDIFAD